MILVDYQNFQISYSGDLRALMGCHKGDLKKQTDRYTKISLICKSVELDLAIFSDVFM